VLTRHIHRSRAADLAKAAATSIEQLRQFGINQILIPATTVIGASVFYDGEILGHVLQSETDALFRNRKRS
jgi:hypothetical protein